MIRTRAIRARLHQRPEALPLAQHTHLRRCAACDGRFTGRRDDVICAECTEDGVSMAGTAISSPSRLPAI